MTKLRDTLAPHVDSGEIPGLVALVSDGRRAGRDARRLRSTARPVQRDSIFRISSMTKPVVAAAALLLVADGAFGLDEPVDRLLPELADRRVLTAIDADLDDTVPPTARSPCATCSRSAWGWAWSCPRVRCSARWTTCNSPRARPARRCRRSPTSGCAASARCPCCTSRASAGGTPPAPVVALHRAVAVAEVEGPAAALDLVDALDLDRYHLLHAVRGDLLDRLGRHAEARAAFEAAAARTGNEAEQAFLRGRAAALPDR